MLRIKLFLTNKRAATLATLIIIAYCLTTILFPLLFAYIIPQSGIGYYLREHLYYGYLFIPIMIYVIYIGVYYFKIKIDSYVIDIRSQRVISGIFKPPNYIDISHSMLDDFAFFNRPFSFNKTLMIKIVTDSGNKITKRFNLTLLSKEEENRISKVLERIIAK